MQQREHYEQVAFVNWCRSPFIESKYKGVSKIFAIANGGHRHISVARRLKSEGVLAGVPDLLLCVARGGFHGLFLEMKTKDGRLSKEQKERGDSFRDEGYQVVVVRGCLEAMAAIEEYYSKPAWLMGAAANHKRDI